MKQAQRLNDKRISYYLMAIDALNGLPMTTAAKKHDYIVKPETARQRVYQSINHAYDLAIMRGQAFDRPWNDYSIRGFRGRKDKVIPQLLEAIEIIKDGKPENFKDYKRGYLTKGIIEYLLTNRYNSRSFVSFISIEWGLLNYIRNYNESAIKLINSFSGHIRVEL